MARITVEDCLENVENRFELVLLSSQRARQLELTAAEPMVPVENDKPTLISLREIADGLINQEVIDKINSPDDEEPEFIGAADGSE